MRPSSGQFFLSADPSVTLLDSEVAFKSAIITRTICQLSAPYRVLLTLPNPLELSLPPKLCCKIALLLQAPINYRYLLKPFYGHMPLPYKLTHVSFSGVFWTHSLCGKPINHLLPFFVCTWSLHVPYSKGPKGLIYVEPIKCKLILYVQNKAVIILLIDILLQDDVWHDNIFPDTIVHKSNLDVVCGFYRLFLRFYFEFLYVGMYISLAAPGKHFVMLHWKHESLLHFGSSLKALSP